MKKVHFYSIVMEGFGSFRDKTKFKFDDIGVNLMKGENGNGKTTIFSALCWALYNSNLKDEPGKDVATWERYRGSNYKGTRVILRLKVEQGDTATEYMIARHLDYKGTTKGYKAMSKLMIFAKDAADTRDFEPEDLLGDKQHKDDMNKFISKLVGLDDNAFLNSIVFGQRMKRLIEADNKDKRALFESIFDVDFVALAKEKAEEKITESNSQIQSHRADSASLDMRIQSNTEKIESYNKVLKHFEIDKQERIESMEAESEALSESVKELSAELKKLEPLAAKYDRDKLELLFNAVDDKRRAWVKADGEASKAAGAIVSSTNTIEQYEAAVKKLEQSIDKVKTECPTCKGPLKKTDIEQAKNSIREQVKAEQTIIEGLLTNKKQQVEYSKELDKKTAALEKDYTDSKKEAEELKAGMAGFQKASEDLRVVKNTLTLKQGQLDSLAVTIQKEHEKEPPAMDIIGLKKAILDAEEKIKLTDKAMAVLTEEVARLTWWVKKGFSSSGLKAFVFNAMLAQLNLAVQKYAARLGLGVSFEIDLTKESKPFLTRCYKENEEVSYASLSGGEKQRIDVCMAFAMHDIITSKVEFNILAMDEIFEGLDAEGIETVFDLIRVKAGTGKALYIISHSPLLDSLNCKNIYVDKDRATGVSYIN